MVPGVQWRMSCLSSDVMNELSTPEEIDARTEDVTLEQVAERIRISADPEEHLHWLQEDAAMGFDAVYVHNVNRDQKRFIQVYGEKVLPRLKAG